MNIIKILSFLVSCLWCACSLLAQAQPPGGLKDVAESPYYLEAVEGTIGKYILLEKNNRQPLDTLSLSFFKPTFFIPHPDTIVFLDKDSYDSKEAYLHRYIRLKNGDGEKTHEHERITLFRYNEELLNSKMFTLAIGLGGNKDEDKKRGQESLEYTVKYYTMRQRAWDTLADEEKARLKGIYGEGAEKRVQNDLVFTPDSVRAFVPRTARDSAVYRALYEEHLKRAEEAQNSWENKRRDSEIRNALIYIKTYESLSEKERAQADSLLQQLEIDQVDGVKLLYEFNNYLLNNYLHPLQLIAFSWPKEKMAELAGNIDSLLATSDEDRLLYNNLRKRLVALEIYREEVRQMRIAHLVSSFENPLLHRDFRSDFYLLDANRIGFKEKVNRNKENLYSAKPTDFVNRVVDLRYDLKAAPPKKQDESAIVYRGRVNNDMRIVPLGKDASYSPRFITLLEIPAFNFKEE